MTEDQKKRKREYMRLYRERNRERFNEYHREYYHKRMDDPEYRRRFNECQREYYRSHKGGEHVSANGKEIPKIRMTSSETQTLYQLIGARCNAEEVAFTMESRLRKCGAYHIVKCAAGMLYKAVDLVCHTIPIDKIAQLRRDMDHVMTTTRIVYTGATASDPYGFVNRRALEQLIDFAREYRCDMCDKCGHDVKKCAFRRTVNELLPYNIVEVVNGECSFNLSRGYETIRGLAHGTIQPDQEEEQ